MNYNIEIRNIPITRVATIKFAGPSKEASKQMPKVFMSIKGNQSGAPFFNYHNFNPETGIGEIDLCVPTNETPSSNTVQIKELPKIKALCLTHVGPYESLPNAYNELYSYAKENNITLQPPWREVYIKGPGLVMKGNPDKYITEIIFPIKED